MSRTADSVEPADHSPPLGVLDIVRDREDDDPTDAVVINCPPVAAEEWTVYRDDGDEDRTVADENPGYDAEAEVVVVAYREELNDWKPEFTDTTDPLPLAQAGVNTYAFPPGRLRRIATICPESRHGTGESETEANTEGRTSSQSAEARDGDTDTDTGGEPTLRDRLDAIAGAVGALNVDGVAVDTFREAVVVEKMGIEYEISTDGTVDADDRIADELEATAEEVVAE